jgi:hypothetical protein
MRRATIAACVALVTLPATASAALPVHAHWYNDSQARGGYMETTHHTVRALWLFCSSPKDASDPVRDPYRAQRYEVPDWLHVGRDGRFSYSGSADRYGAEGQSLGRSHVSLSGRFVTPSRVKIKRKLKGCGTAATVTITPER